MKSSFSSTDCHSESKVFFVPQLYEFLYFKITFFLH